MESLRRAGPACGTGRVRSPDHCLAPDKRLFQAVLIAICFLQACILTAGAQPIADDTLKNISFDQHPGARVNPELHFRDENGREVRLGDFLGKKPAVLILGYYGCPMLCTFVINGLIGSLENIDWEIGNQFEVINVSIDPRESPALAAAKKKSYLKRYGRPNAGPGWHFLTGDEPAIQRLAAEVGFNYAYDAEIRQYAHPSGLVILTPDGKISHYLSGVVYSPESLKNALQDASASKIGSPIRQLFLLCFHYSPITGKYGPAIMLVVRGCGLAVLLTLAVMVASMVRHEGNKTSKAAPPAGTYEP